jgi:hypothetical protein
VVVLADILEEVDEMSKYKVPRTRLSMVSFLFTLMLAVFAFGLHARIESVRTGASTTAAKLSVDKRSPASAVAETAEADPPEPFAAALHALLSGFATALPSQEAFRTLNNDWSLRKTSSLDSHGPSSMLRPPPFQL